MIKRSFPALMFSSEVGFDESVAARSFAASRVMSFPEVRKRSAPEVISLWRLVVLSMMRSPPFFLLPQCCSVRSRFLSLCERGFCEGIFF